MLPLRDKNPTRRAPLMTWAIIGSNVLVFGFELMLPSDVRNFVFSYAGTVPARLGHSSSGICFGLRLDDYWTLLTCMFLHVGWLHIITNMWALWIFGDNVEDRMGHFRFLFFYLLCGLAAGIVHVVTNTGSTVPAVGASGAIAGVVGAYLILFPRARILTVFLFFPFFFYLPAAAYILIWFLLQFFLGIASLAGPRNVGGIAWWAHIGGFAAGIVFLRPFLRQRDGATGVQ
jgi:membrane associated rhomboid family serine protease